MVPQSPAASNGRLQEAQTASRPVQKRWPMALSIWTAVAMSLVMWTGIVWIISVFIGLFN